MGTAQKDWLVRTRSGELLGPFTESELLTELNRRVFSIDDEIASGDGAPWVSANILQAREREEFTNTSTRNTATGDVGTKTGEELTPTPVATPPASKTPSRPVIIPLWTAVFVTLTAFALLFKLNGKKETVKNPAPTSFAADEAESAITKKAYQLIQSGETGTALKQLTEYHEKAPTKESLDYLIPYAAILILEEESLPRAKKFLETVITSQSSPRLKARAHHWLGYLLLSQDEGDMGESHFLESLQLNPKDAASRFNLGRAYLKQKKFSQALDYLQLAELEVPDLWLVHIYKGRAKAELHQLEEARQSFKNALAVSPDRWICHVYYAFFLNGMRGPYDVAEARAVMKRMLTRDPHYEQHSPPPFGYYQEHVNYQEYLSAYQRVMEKGPAEERELGRFYLTYLMNGAGTEDLKRFDAMAKYGSLTAQILALKVALETKSKPDELRERLRRLPENLTPFGAYGYVLRGETRLRLGDSDGAKENFQTALKMEPKSAVAHWAMASLLERQSHTPEAQAEIERLLALHPHYIPALLSSRHY